ncbi:MAG: aromatic ring-hydroxylating dioxygenase subunit alpha [Geminicoccaceae bacterium]
MTFVRNNWYPAGFASRMGEGLHKRRMLGEDLVIWQQADGGFAALQDRCPHRFLPLSMGCLERDTVRCGYHGMTFAADGRCVRIPGQPTIPPSARVRSYPVELNLGLVWVWMGDPALASRELLFDLPEYHEAGWHPVDGEALEVEANYLALADNLCDPAHVAFVHLSTLGNAAHEDVPIETKVEGELIVTTRWTIDAEPIPLFQKFGSFKGNIDRWQIYNYHAPSIAVIDFGGADTGTGAREGRLHDGAIRILACHFICPVDEARSIDYWLHVDNFPSDAATRARMNEQFALAFAEDKAILEAIQVEETKLGGRQRPLRLGIDKGAVLMRKTVERMIEAERSVMAAE